MNNKRKQTFDVSDDDIKPQMNKQIKLTFLDSKIDIEICESPLLESDDAFSMNEHYSDFIL